MDDLQTINQIIAEAVKDSSYISVLISSCVFIIYTIIIKVTDVYKSKTRNKPMLEMADAIRQISENVVKLNSVLDKTFQDSEIKETKRINSIISTSFSSFKANILSQCLDVIIHNHIDNNKDRIKHNINKIVSTEYYKVYSIFSEYEHDSVNLSTKLKDDWIENITEEVLQIIYNGQDSVERIRQLNYKLTILTEEFSIYINNKVFNH